MLFVPLVFYFDSLKSEMGWDISQLVPLPIQKLYISAQLLCILKFYIELIQSVIPNLSWRRYFQPEMVANIRIRSNQLSNI